jgi:ABC-type sugar transport system permease subunit
LVFSFWPGGFTFFISFFRTNLLTDWKFVLFNNYKATFSDGVFHQALFNTFLYLIYTVPAGLIISLFLSALISKTSVRAKKIYTAFYFAATITSIIAVGIVWKILYFPKLGLFGLIISKVFHLTPPAFLVDAKSALLSIAIMDIWLGIGFRTIILTTAIDEIPDSIIESSMIDGSYGLNQFFRIVLPLIKRQILFLIAMGTIAAVNIYGQVYVMTYPFLGGPGHVTESLGLNLYLQGFKNGQFGSAAVIGIIMFLLSIGITYAVIKTGQVSESYYD